MSHPNLFEFMFNKYGINLNEEDLQKITDIIVNDFANSKSMLINEIDKIKFHENMVVNLESFLEFDFDILTKKSIESHLEYHRKELEKYIGLENIKKISSKNYGDDGVGLTPEQINSLI